MNDKAQSLHSIITESQAALAKVKPTRCFELLHLAKKGFGEHFELQQANYSAYGLVATVRDTRDGQVYTVKIEPGVPTEQRTGVNRG